MDDLISRQAAIEEIQNAYCDTECGKDWCAVWKNKGLYEALRILEDVPPAQRWIPVVEPPEKDGWYWVYAPEYKGGSSSGLKFIDGMMLSKFKSGRWSIEHGYYKRPGCVTHWMPLPELPKEDSNEV